MHSGTVKPGPDYDRERRMVRQHLVLVCRLETSPCDPGCMAMLCVNPGRLKALEYALRGAFSTCALLSIGGLPLPYGLPYGLLTRGCPWGGPAYSVRPS